MARFKTSTVALVVFATSLLSAVHGHGFTYQPACRGIMPGGKIVGSIPAMMPSMPKSCLDYSAHFPAGDKRRIPGIGLKSQIAAANGTEYKLYNPTEPGFVFRSLLLSSGQALHPCLVRICSGWRLRSQTSIRCSSQRLHGDARL